MGLPKTDIWMPLYIADYFTDTADLDAEESGAYLHWLMIYWRDGPLVNDLSRLIRISKLSHDDAPSIAQAVLARFFTLEDDGRWHQKRLDRELLKWNTKKLKATQKAEVAAKIRWSRNATSIPPCNANGNAHAMHESCPSPSPVAPPSPVKGSGLPVSVLPS